MLTVSDKGLEVKNVNNEWIEVHPIPGTFIINIGDMLQKVTKGLYKSTVHRVVCTGKERYSMPYFYDPGWDERIVEIDFPMNKE
jgi:isopenicillin N synthase-like dioxygenase